MFALLRYKTDILSALKERGYTTYTLRKASLISEGSIQNIRQGKPPRPDTLNTLCKLLDCQPGDILEYVPDDNE